MLKPGAHVNSGRFKLSQIEKKLWVLYTNKIIIHCTYYGSVIEQIL